MTLTSLRFLAPGEQWPPPSEAARLDQYRANHRLFSGEHDRVFENSLRLMRDEFGVAVQIALNWPKRLSMLWADLLIGEPPVYTAEGNQDALDELTERNQLNTAAYEVALDISRYGDGLFRVRLEDGEGVIEGQSPEYWYPVVRPENIRKFTHHVLAWAFEREESVRLGTATETKRYLYAEIHTPGHIERRVHRLEDNRIREAVSLDVFADGLSEVEETGAEDFLVVHAPGVRTTERLHGLNDYSDLESLLEEREVRLAQISRILDAFADPQMAGPPQATNYAEPGGKYWEIMDKDSIVPQFLTWDGNLAAAFQELEAIEKELYFISETSPVAFGHSESGYAESGTSLKLRMVAPLAKVSRIRTRFDPALRRAIRVAGGLQGTEIGDVRIDWRDGLPEDKREQAEIEERRVASGTTSKLSAIQRLDEVDEDQAEEELERIEEESASEAGASAGGMSIFGGREGAPSRDGNPAEQTPVEDEG